MNTKLIIKTMTGNLITLRRHYINRS